MPLGPYSRFAAAEVAPAEAGMATAPAALRERVRLYDDAEIVVAENRSDD